MPKHVVITNLYPPPADNHAHEGVDVLAEREPADSAPVPVWFAHWLDNELQTHESGADMTETMYVLLWEMVG